MSHRAIATFANTLTIAALPGPATVALISARIICAVTLSNAALADGMAVENCSGTVVVSRAKDTRRQRDLRDMLIFSIGPYGSQGIDNTLPAGSRVLPCQQPHG